MSKIDKRYDFVFFFDVKDGNPNGDPDAGNLPRIDAETGMGLVTDVCLKRKVRNYVQLTQITNGKPNDRYDIFIKEKDVLNRAIVSAWDEANKGKTVKTVEEKRNAEESTRKRMCEKFYDIRIFGAVLATSDKEKDGESEDDKKLRKTGGQVRGPVQFTFARSVEPVVALEHSITRMAVTNEKDLEKERTFGRKYTVPYGLYRAHGFISAHLADQTGFTTEDLDIFWKAMHEMFEHDHSAARGLMCTRKLVVFEHATALGNKPAHELFERVTCERKNDKTKPAREFTDYDILLDGKSICTETFHIVKVE
ncbi:MAG: type I-C CRISPR-associated protein Cas7/Csd2 [Bacteroidetes bacterium]|nr:type I-C CRISPR-associated protein Cas7/Csd2 [Bacteroidota bacterium]MCL6099004.1 type I-C CRISPR-associated protein Cas7/Csd2 [Bacteroidota bacterium]